MRHVCPNDRSRAIMLEQLNMSQPDPTESDNQGSVSFVNSLSFDCSEATSRRFRQGSFLEIYLIRYPNYRALLNVLLWDSEEFREPTWIKVCFLEKVAHSIVSPAAVMAVVAGDVMVRDDSIPFREFFYTLTESFYRTANLVSENPARSKATVQFLNISATNPSHFQPDQSVL